MWGGKYKEQHAREGRCCFWGPGVMARPSSSKDFMWCGGVEGCGGIESLALHLEQLPRLFSAALPCYSPPLHYTAHRHAQRRCESPPLHHTATTAALPELHRNCRCAAQQQRQRPYSCGAGAPRTPAGSSGGACCACCCCCCCAGCGAGSAPAGCPAAGSAAGTCSGFKDKAAQALGRPDLQALPTLQAACGDAAPPPPEHALQLQYTTPHSCYTPGPPTLTHDSSPSQPSRTTPAPAPPTSISPPFLNSLSTG